MKLDEKINKTTNNVDVTLLSRKEVSCLLGVSIMTIKRYQGRGLLKAVYLSSRLVRYRKQDVNALICQAVA